LGRKDGHPQTPRAGASERRADAVLELAERQPGGVPHDVRAVTHRGERRALGGDRFAEALAVLAEGVAAARLAVAADQRVVLRVQEQHLGPEAGFGELLDRGDRIAERPERANVQRKRRVDVPRLLRERDKRTREHGRRVV